MPLETEQRTTHRVVCELCPERAAPAWTPEMACRFARLLGFSTPDGDNWYCPDCAEAVAEFRW